MSNDLEPDHSAILVVSRPEAGMDSVRLTINHYDYRKPKDQRITDGTYINIYGDRIQALIDHLIQLKAEIDEERKTYVIPRFP